MRKRSLLEGACLVFCIIFFSCEKIEVVKDPIKHDCCDIMWLSVKGIDGAEFKSFYINDSTVHIVVPNQYCCSGLKTIVKHNALYASIDGVELNDQVEFDFSDFTNPKELKLVSSLGKEKKYKIIVHDLPVVIIDTPANRQIDSKTERVDGCVVRLAEASGTIDSLGTAGIRGRGNSSWEQPKKPYNIKFDSETPILGMPKSKHWIILSNTYYDRTQLHNATAFEMARLTDYPWVQDGRFVELILNGEHKGLYYICEKIREEKGKIELKDEDFLLESFVVLKSGYEGYEYPDNYFSTQYFNETGIAPFDCVLGWETKFPEKPELDRRNQIKAQLENVEALIYDYGCLLTGQYRKWFDIETSINWYLVEEVALNEEASRTKNFYLYSDGGVLYVGPPWDFDAWTFGSRGKRQFSCRYSSFFFPQLLKDPFFIQRLKEKWYVYKVKWERAIPEFIEIQYNTIRRSVERNEKMWPEWHPVNYPETKTYRELIDNMKDSFVEQLEWLDGEIRMI